VYGGPHLVVRYGNGDEVEYLTVVFACTVLAGTPRSDGDETIDVRFWRAGENPVLSSWLQPLFTTFLEREAASRFEPPTWQPPA
jgi:hypothetical protein